MLVTLNDVRIATVPVPLKFTQARQTPTVASFNTVPVVAGKVSVVVPETAGAASVICPDESPAMTSEDMSILYKTTQREPDGMVTVTPADNVIGPTDMAHDPDVMVYEAVTVLVFS